MWKWKYVHGMFSAGGLITSHVYTCACAHTHTHTHVCVCMCCVVCVCVCVCVCQMHLYAVDGWCVLSAYTSHTHAHTRACAHRYYYTTTQQLPVATTQEHTQ